MTDIVERLRETARRLNGLYRAQEPFTEAADEIEKLDQRLVLAWKTIGERDDEIERLRAELEATKAKLRIALSTEWSRHHV